MGTFSTRQYSAASAIALNCGTPTPATTRVVQIDPGPIPTLTESAPRIHQGFRPVLGGNISCNNLGVVTKFLDPRNGVEHPRRVAVCGIDDDNVTPGIDQCFGTREAVVTDISRRGNTEAALLVLTGVGMKLRFLDVFYRNQADAPITVVDDNKLFDPVLMEQAFSLFAINTVLHGHEVFMGHQFANRLLLIGRKPNVAIV